MRSSTAKTIDEGLSKAHRVFADYIGPERKSDAAQTVDALLGILDDKKFNQAWDELQQDCPDTDLPVSLISHEAY
jgi:hypothetical protein